MRFAGQTVATKVAKVNNLNAELAEETGLLQIVAGHPNVAQMFGGVEKHSCCSSACAFLGPNLQQVLAKRKRLSAAAMYTGPWGLVSGLAHMHRFRVARCDICDRNICCSVDAQMVWELCIIDLDAAKQLPSPDFTSKPMFMPADESLRTSQAKWMSQSCSRSGNKRRHHSRDAHFRLEGSAGSLRKLANKEWLEAACGCCGKEGLSGAFRHHRP